MMERPSNVEKLAGTLRLLVNVAMVLAGIHFAGSMLGVGMDDTDVSATKRSGMRLHTDALTGCQYLAANGGGITPRLDASGKHICRP